MTAPPSASDSTTLTWVGHSSVIIDTGGQRIVTDPLLTDRVAHLRRRVGAVTSDHGDVDLAVVSHAHMDHLHLPSLRRLSPRAELVVPSGTERLASRSGRAVRDDVGAGDRLEVGRTTIEVTDAVHKHGRGPHSRVRARPVGFVIETAGLRVYFAGDTDLFDGMADLGPVDVALLPIWGWGAGIGVGHLDPSRAARATAMIDPRHVVPIHWGTFSPENGRRRAPNWIDQPLRRFADELDAVGLGDRLLALEPGGSARITPPPGSDGDGDIGTAGPGRAGED
jgi:L-ascorbate metabolism protein UlaG (beta-lactamase superfamily)